VHKVCEPKGFTGERFALLFDSTILHWSGTAAAGEPGGHVDTLYFLNGHFLSNAHPCHIECIDLQGGGTVALFSVRAAFNYMKAQFFGNWVSANRVLESQSPAEANSIGDAVSGDFIAQDGWDRQVAKEKMLLALEKK
jgi:predicted NAD-dependent protein-ADP-ribosyltransferase YbiA (DUF1768 family)